MTIKTLNKKNLIQQAEALLHQLSPERIQSAIDYMTYIKDQAEPEDFILTESNILPRLIAQALQQHPSPNWEEELDAL